MTAVQMAAVLPAASPASAARPSDGGDFARHLASAASPASTSTGDSSGKQETADAPSSLPVASPGARGSDSEDAASLTEFAQELLSTDRDAAEDGELAADGTDVAADAESGDPSADADPNNAATHGAVPASQPAVLTEEAPRTPTALGSSKPPSASAAPSTPPGPETSALSRAGSAAPTQQAPAAGPSASAGLGAPAQGEAPAQPTAVPVVDTAGGTNPSGQETQARADGLAVTTPAPAATTSVSPAAPAAPPPAPALPLAPQLAPQLAHLRQLPQGEHVLTLSVTPDTFGPVKVVAHITAEGTTVQLLGSTEASREALRAALADLRRDLAATGMDARLDVGNGRGEDGAHDGRGPRAGSPDTSGTVRSGQGEPAALTSTPAPVASRSRGVDLFL